MNLTRLRYQRFHTSILLGWMAAGVLAGLVVRRQVEGLDPTPSVFICLVLLLGGFRSQRWWAIVAVLFAGLLLGISRGSETQSQYDQYKQYYDQPAVMSGTLAEDPQRSGASRQRVTLSHVKVNDTSMVGETFVTIVGSHELERGDTVTVKGMLREGFATYPVTVPTATILKHERGKDIIRDVREAFASAVRSVMVEPMASLGLGFVVGQRSTLPDMLDEQLKVVGLTHIVVASGYNLTILVRFVMRLLSRHSRYAAFVVSLLMIAAFVMFSGFSPSMNRAVVVTVLGLLAWYVGRRFHPVLLILYVAGATALVNPMYVWSDLGWYLSFFAFAGILVVAPLVIRLVYRRRDPSPFEQVVFETMSAELMALPIVALAFGTIPVFALVANIMVGIFIPLAMILTAVTGVVAMLSTSFAGVFAAATNILIGYIVAVVEWLSSLPMATANVALPLWVIVAWYVVIAGMCLWAVRRLRYNFRSRDTGLEL